MTSLYSLKNVLAIIQPHSSGAATWLLHRDIQPQCCHSSDSGGEDTDAVQNLPYMFNWLENWWQWRPYHMIEIILHPHKPFSEPWFAMDGAMTSDTENCSWTVIQVGIPTKNFSRIHKAMFHSYKHRWHHAIFLYFLLHLCFEMCCNINFVVVIFIWFLLDTVERLHLLFKSIVKCSNLLIQLLWLRVRPTDLPSKPPFAGASTFSQANALGRI